MTTSPDSRREEALLQQSETRFRTLIETAVDGILTIDARGLINFVNPAVERLFGYKREELLGRNVSLLMPSPDHERHDAYMARYLRTGERHIIGIGREVVALRKDGSTFPMHLSIGEYQVDGQRYFTGIVRDISDRKLVEAQLTALNETLEQRVADRTAALEERTAELQKRTEQLRMMSSELSQAEQRERRRLAQLLHDHLQQLLVAVRFRLRLLRQRASLQDLARGAQMMDDLLGQAMEVSRSLTVELSPPVLYDRGLVAALQWLGRWMHDKHGLTVHVDASDSAEPQDQDVRVFLFQAVRELLFNVVKHAKVREADVILACCPKHQIEIRVEDRGAGFDPTALKQRRASQAGFGLFSIQQRLDLLGGEVLVEGSPGRGTRITLRVPNTPAPAPAPGPPSPDEPRTEALEEEMGRRHPPRAGKLRVLLADDHAILRQGLAGLLGEEPDIEIVGEASDGQIAVELARELHPDAVIMDITMPRMDGIEATRRIKAELPQIRVIGLSMHERADVAVAIREAGAAAFLSKDGPVDNLIAAIRDEG